MTTTQAEVRRAPYTGLSVVELAEETGGEFLGRLLAEMGADVIKVEPPQGSPTRAIGPFARHQSGPDSSLHFWFYNGNKRSVVLDIAAAGAAALHPLLQSADILITTFQPGRLKTLGLDLDELSRRFPRLIIASVTPFGLEGPWADYKSSDLVGLAAGGPLIMCGYDDHAIPPIKPGGDQAYHTVTAFAHIGVLLALLRRQQTGEGQIVDLSMHGACAVNVELANPFWFYPRVLVHRQTCRHAQPSPTQTAMFRCADGRYVYYALILSDQRAWNILVQWMESKGMAAMLSEPEYQDVAFRQQNFHLIQELVECFFLVQDSHDAYHEGQACGLPIGVMNAPEDLLADEHLAAREFFIPVDMGGEVGSVPYPGDSYRFSAFAGVPRKRAPHLGEHTNEVLHADAAVAERT